MKEIRTKFSDEEYTSLNTDAGKLHISIQKLVHDRALQQDSMESPLSGARVLSNGMSEIRSSLNQIIRQETDSNIRLYEDDMICIETAMAELEHIVCRYISSISKKGARCDG